MRMVKKCEYCSNEFEVHKNAGKRQRFCSKKCRGRWRYENPKTSKAKCENCNKTYTPKIKDRNKFCSRECYFESIKAKPKEKKVHQIKCVICNEVFESKRSNTKYCSNDCRNVKRAKVTKERYFVSVKQTNPFIEKECKQCGGRFNTNFMASSRKYCSKQCAKRAVKQQRSYRKRGQFVERVYRAEIYKRDDGKCQICGKKVDLTKVAPHPKSPTLDHIIPLAKGGTHEPKNVQLAHFICNSLKGDRDGGQLRMF